MVKGILHLHITVAFLSFFLFFVKTILLNLNQKERLESVRAKTKILEMVIGFLLIATGVYLLFQVLEVQTYHIIKLLIIFAIVPLGIVSLKNQNKAMAFLVVLLYLYAFRIANVKSVNPMGQDMATEQKIETNDNSLAEVPDSVKQNAVSILDQNKENSLVKGKSLFEINCSPCHGLDGKKGLSGAKDLTQTEKSHNEKVNIIRYGKGLMTAFGTQLSEEEIESVAYYVDSMRQ